MIQDYIGLYRHFKGGYYFIYSVIRSESDDHHYACYYNVLFPSSGSFCRKITEMFDDVSDRKDNVTGQKTRFERVISIDTAVKNVSTKALEEELSTRSDSIYQTLDIEGLNKKVVSTDYIIGQFMEGDEDYDSGVRTVNAFGSLDECTKHIDRFGLNPLYRIYKRVFIEVEI